MSHISDEVLMAYADNELSPEDCAELEARLAHEADLRARLEPFQATGLRLQAVFDAHLEEPVPARLIDAVLSSPAQRTSKTWAHNGGGWLGSIARTLFPETPYFATAFGIGALLLVGCLAAWVAGRDQTSASPLALLAFDNGELVAAGPLERALETAPSQPALGAAAIHPTMSFMSRDGAFCREYRVAGDKAFSGVACRKAEGVWRIAAHVETAAAQNNSGYQTASGPGTEPLNAIVDTLLQGDVLSADDEATIIAQSWRAAGQADGSPRQKPSVAAGNGGR